MTLPGPCFDLKTAPEKFLGDTGRGRRGKLSAHSRQWNQRQLGMDAGIPSGSDLQPLHGPLKTEHQTDRGLCLFARTPAESLPVTPKDSTKALRIFILTRLKPLAPRRAGKEANPLALYFPNSWDGLLGVRFVNSVIESSKANGKWTKC